MFSKESITFTISDNAQKGGNHGVRVYNGLDNVVNHHIIIVVKLVNNSKTMFRNFMFKQHLLEYIG